MRTTLIVSLVSLLLSLLAGEAYLRMAGFAPKAAWVNANFDGSNWGMEDPVLGWVNRPGRFASLEKGGAEMSFQPDHSRTSRPAVRTGASAAPPADVLVVGCSFTQGYSVADADTYAWRLGERFPGLVIDNFGTGGYSTYQALLRVRNELATRKEPPRLVILGFIAHQMVRTVAPPDWVKYLTDRNGALIVPPSATVDGDRLVEHPMETVNPWLLEHHSALVTELHAGVLRLRLGDRMAQRVPATAAVVRSMRDLVEARGGRLLVALLDDASLPGGKPDYDALVGSLAAARVAHADCVDPEYDANPSALQVGGSGHPNGTVHRRWADCIGRWVEANLPGIKGAAP